MKIFAIFAGLGTIYLTVTKPDFYWNHRKAVAMRKIFGDRGATLFYLLIGIAMTTMATLAQLGIIAWD